MTTNTTFHIEIQIDPEFSEQVNEAILQTATAAALHHEGAVAGAALTIVITDDEKIRQLNRQFRQVDTPTDVLAFFTANDGSFVEAPEQPPYLGDVIISYPRAAEQAAEAGHPIEAELALLAAHGTLHLLGHDHASPKEKAAMWAAQKAILKDCEFQIENW